MYILKRRKKIYKKKQRFKSFSHNDIIFYEFTPTWSIQVGGTSHEYYVNIIHH